MYKHIQWTRFIKKEKEKKEKVSAYTPANHARIYIQEFQ